MTYKDIQTALKAIKIKKTIQENFTLLGEFYALKENNLFYVIFLSKPLMVKIYRCDTLDQAETLANGLNNVPKQ